MCKWIDTSLLRLLLCRIILPIMLFMHTAGWFAENKSIHFFFLKNPSLRKNSSQWRSKNQPMFLPSVQKRFSLWRLNLSFHFQSSHLLCHRDFLEVALTKLFIWSPSEHVHLISILFTLHLSAFGSGSGWSGGFHLQTLKDKSRKINEDKSSSLSDLLSHQSSANWHSFQIGVTGGIYPSGHHATDGNAPWTAENPPGRLGCTSLLKPSSSMF